MVRIEVETWIAVSPERCFDLARDMRIHARTMANSCERVIGDPGLLGLGDVVTFEAEHLGIRQRFTARVTAYDRPHAFTDEMVRGAFRSFAHEHRFEPEGDGTKMVDVIQFEAPLGFLGRLAESLILRRYLAQLITQRGQALKRIAESAW